MALAYLLLWLHATQTLDYPHLDSHTHILLYIGVGSGAAGAALAAPIFCLVAVLGPRFFSIRQLFVL